MTTCLYLFTPQVDTGSTATRVGVQAAKNGGKLVFSWDQSIEDYNFAISFTPKGSQTPVHSMNITPTTPGITTRNGLREYLYTIPASWDGYYSLDFQYGSQATVTQLEVKDTNCLEEVGLRLQTHTTGIRLAPVLKYSIVGKVTIDTKEVIFPQGEPAPRYELGTSDSPPQYMEPPSQNSILLADQIYTEVTIPVYGLYFLTQPTISNTSQHEVGGGETVVVEDPDEDGY